MIGKKKRIHFIGIGGSGMNPLANIMLEMGYEISGSDMKENVYTLKLKEAGAQIFYGHSESNIRTTDIVVLSSAIKSDNVEYQAALSNGLKVIKRAELLSFIMDKHENRIAVAGTHGKTTTTGMIANFLSEIEDPTYIIGATLKHLKKAAHKGESRYIVVEADESDRSLLFLNPNIIVITNIEAEHMDEYKDENDIVETFNKFIHKLPEDKNLLIACGDDKNIQKLTKTGIKVITYGFNENNLIWATNIKLENGFLFFDVIIDNIKVADRIKLNVPGKHNILNSLAVFALANHLGRGYSAVIKSLSIFEGASRRFHLVGSIDEVVVYDDYAHHPTEIRCTLEAAKTFGKRIVVVFQPHRFSRFSAFFDDFANALKLAEVIVVTDVFAAGETNYSGLTSQDLVDKIKDRTVLYVKSVGEIASKTLPLIKKGDLVITLGAGDITHVSKEIFQKLKAK